MSRRRTLNGTASTTSTKSTRQKVKTTNSIVHSPRTKLIILSCCLVLVAIILYDFRSVFVELVTIPTDSVDLRHTSKQSSGGWRLADEETRQKYDSNICNIDRKWAHELSTTEFENVYRHKKPVIISFKGGAEDWTDPAKWSVNSLKKDYGKWSVLSGNAREIVRKGGSGYVDTTFSEYVDKLMSETDQVAEPFYVFDRDFYNDTSLPSSMTPPQYLHIENGTDDSIFFLGSSGSGVSFHKHADAWNGVVYGRKRWFLYTIDKTPPGGVYPGFTQREWFEKIYPKLPTRDKPLECIQEPGEIFYLPESIYHGTINIGDTIAIGIQKREAVTTLEKLFYDERKLVESMQNKNTKEKEKLLKEKQGVVEQILKLLPGNAEIQMKAGSMYAEVGNLVEARRHTQRAIELDEYFLVAVLNLAGIESQLGNMEEADWLYRHAREMNADLWDVYAQYGDFLMSTGRSKEAVEIYRKGTEIEPNTLAFWMQLMYAQQLSGDIRGAEATQKVIDQMKA